MNFLCDIHIAKKLSKRLQELGHTSIHVNEILDKWFTEDPKISEYCNQNDIILISKDQDFRDSHLIIKKPKKLIKVNLGNISNKDLIQAIEEHLDWIGDVNSNSEFFMIEIFKNDVWVITR
jgi:predicted nuclease of predicted toxin-antitoxin system